MRLEAYPYKAPCDIELAVARAVAKLITPLQFSMPKQLETFSFRGVYEEWAEFQKYAFSEGADLPAAAVLSDNVAYSDSQFAPALIEDTWSGGDRTECDPVTCKPLYPIGDGSLDGFVLVKVCEVDVPLSVYFRAQHKPQRSAMMRRLEQIFSEDETIIDPNQLDPDLPPPADVLFHHPTRFGRLLELPDHYDRQGRVTLLSSRRLDSAESAAENRWMGLLELSVQAPLCVLRRAQGMKIVTKLSFDDVPASEEGTG